MEIKTKEDIDQLFSNESIAAHCAEIEDFGPTDFVDTEGAKQIARYIFKGSALQEIKVIDCATGKEYDPNTIFTEKETEELKKEQLTFF